MTDLDVMVDRFEEHRSDLRAVAYRLLGTLSDTDDAIQETWLRYSSADVREVRNTGAWLTTVIGRICLNMLRARTLRREHPLEPWMPDPVVSGIDSADPEQQALLGDSLGLALLVVLENLSPPERLAFVLHDAFGVPFDSIAEIGETTTAAARQLASRARRKVRQERTEPDAEPARQRKVVDAFFAASQRGDFDGLVAVLHPDATLRSDGGRRSIASIILRGAEEIAGQAVQFGALSPFVSPAMVNGTYGVVVAPKGRAVSVMAFTVQGDRIVAIDVLADPARLELLPLPV